MPLFSRFKSILSPKWYYLQNSLHSISRRYVTESYYDILKVPETCSSKDVRDAFINLSKKNHPDKHLNDPTMHERFIKINEAYSVLINPLSRRAYDINLHQKKKLGAPIPDYSAHQRSNAKNSSSSNSANQSFRTNYSSYSQGDPFTFHYHTTKKEERTSEDSYYGVKGVKKVSNNRIVGIVMLTTFLALIIQLLTIRKSVIKSRERMMEESRKNSLIHAMVREKATLYGKEYQINLLKKSLKGVLEEDQKPKLMKKVITSANGSNINNNSSIPSKQPIISSSSVTSGSGGHTDAEFCGKCKKCNHI